MGNIIVTISWIPTDTDECILNTLRDLAIKRGLSVNTNPIYITYSKNKTTFAADISGLYLILNRDTQKIKVENYAKDCLILLKSMNVKEVEYDIDDLPL